MDTSTDVACDNDILSHVGDAYRKIRNTIRFLLGELEGQFDLASDGLAVDELLPNDKLALARMCEVHSIVSEAYENYRFNVVYRTLYDYIITELSNDYLNATKDRTYCGGKDSFERKSALTTWSYILGMLVHDFQPILAYTTDEVMDFLPESLRDGQTHAALLDWFEAPLAKEQYQAYLPVYAAVSAARSSYTRAYDAALAAGVITEKTTQATRAELTLTQDLYDLIVAHKVDLAESFVCSDVCIHVGDELTCDVVPAHGDKCPRCWNWRTVGEDGLCHRCHDTIASVNE